jgi:hypothetical protein
VTLGRLHANRFAGVLYGIAIVAGWRLLSPSEAAEKRER